MSRILKLFNVLLELGHIPKKWKIAQIIMIPKKDKPPDLVTSYRPISLISFLSKCLEKIINSRLQKWLEENHLLPPTQSGFRRKKNTQDHILRLNQSIIQGFNKKQMTGSVFFDLEKAFDKTPHIGILNKINSLPMCPKIKKWIKSFLEGRMFQMKIKDKLSTPMNTTCGVPQGSCISPTLFIIYFSDIAKHIPPEVQHALFADDLAIWFTGSKKKDIEFHLQKAINSINDFCITNGLTINKMKTVHTTFTTAGYRSNYKNKYNLHLTLDDSNIPIDPYPIFLGIKIDPKLNSREHLSNIKTKLMPKIRSN